MSEEVMEHETKQADRMTKASVFEDLFSDRENLFAMYQVLHPEDTTATVNDVRHVTLKNILTRGHYNDLGFVVGKRLMILVEAQSTWSVNIIPRSIMYLAETWSRYFVIECYDIYSSTPVDIPEPELYVIYTGDKKIDKSVITLSDEFFGGKKIAVDAEVKVLKYDGGTGIIDQYIQFCKILDQQRALYPEDGMKAVYETIRICTDADILKNYLEERKQEVIDIMTLLYNQEQATQTMLATERREGAEGKARDMALKMYRRGDSLADIADFVEYSVDVVRRWIRGTGGMSAVSD